MGVRWMFCFSRLGDCCTMQEFVFLSQGGVRTSNGVTTCKAGLYVCSSGKMSSRSSDVVGSHMSSRPTHPNLPDILTNTPDPTSTSSDYTLVVNNKATREVKPRKDNGVHVTLVFRTCGSNQPLHISRGYAPHQQHHQSSYSATTSRNGISLHTSISFSSR